MKRLIAISLLALTAATVTAAGLAQAAEFVVRSQRIDDRKAVFATVESVDVALARARIGGTVTELAIDEGSRVTAGQRVAMIVDPKLRLQLDAVGQRLRSLQAQRELAQLDLKRALDLRRSGAATQARVDDAQTSLEVAERQLAAMRAERQVVEQQLSEGAVLAPADGRVLEVKVTKGSVLMPGEAVAAIAAENFILRLQLPERHARFMRIDDAVQVGRRGLAADGGDLREGRVRQVYPRIENGRVVADVAVDGLGDYFVGERVRVQVSTGRRETFVVPTEYLFRRYGLDFVRLDDGTEVVVQAGRPVNGGIEILAGLRDGDVVVTP